MNGFEIFTGIFGGLGLFLYGMKLMSDGLENVAGEKLKDILEKITSNKYMGVLVGTVVTSIIQSSSATTVMVVSFVNAGLMSLSQATGVILGSNIGTTITAQMVSLDLQVIAPIFVGIGAILMFITKNKKLRDIAMIALGFGILFLGMGTMSSSMKPVSELSLFKDFILVVGNNGLLGVLVGAIMTAVVQSSSATTGILVALAASGSIDLNVAFPIILGCNIGTCITAILASLTANKTAKKAALIHLLFNILGTIIFLPLATPMENLILLISPENVARQVANTHTVFNVVTTLVMLPVIGYIVKLVDKILPDGEKKEQKEYTGSIYLDKKLLETPIVASVQVIKETMRMAEIAKENFRLSKEVFFNWDKEVVDNIYRNENLINTLETEITEYLVELSQHNLPKEDAKNISQAYHVINDIERIGDHCENLTEIATLKFENKIIISEEAVNELNSIFEATLKSLDLAILAFEANEKEHDKNVDFIEEKIDEMEKTFRNNNIKRLNSKVCLANAGVIFFDILSNLERIGDHANNIGTIKDNLERKINL